MNILVKLSGNQCVLLAAQLARDSNVSHLQNLTATRRDAFTNELVLQILLTCLPESVEPSAYLPYVEQIANNVWDAHDQNIPEASSVKELSQQQARKRIRSLGLLPLAHPICQAWEDRDLLTLFVVHRAYRLDQEADLLVLVPQLVGPYIDGNLELRTWFISSVIPLLRLQYEYYATNGVQEEDAMSLEQFDNLAGLAGVKTLMSKAQEPVDGREEGSYNGARDLRGLVGPWMYGSSVRKRRKLNGASRRPSVPTAALGDIQQIDQQGTNMDYVPVHYEWEQAFEYLVQEAAENFEFVTETIEQWNGSTDVDLGGFDKDEPDLDSDTAEKLTKRYVQATFASIYAVRSDTVATVERAHRLLARLADLMGYEPPPDLATSVDLLPRIASQSSILAETSSSVLLENALILPGHPLTTPTTQTYALLHLFIFSAYLLDGLKCSTSIRNVAKLRFQSNADEQLQMLQKIVHIAVTGPHKDDHQWDQTRQRLLWLWNWGFSIVQQDNVQYGEGYFGRLEKRTVEREMLKAFLSAGCYHLVTKTYVSPGLDRKAYGLPSLAEVEQVIIASAMQFYDNASNGNRNRGGMKKASDIISTFRTSFPMSIAFSRCEALLAATHALSFYSLTLQHGVPFQPVSIRVSQDPLLLLQKVLEQNPQSYSKLDDLVFIGKNLVSAGLPEKNVQGSDSTSVDEVVDTDTSQAKAERRVTGMAIEQALAEDDFETAYSYVTARLTPSAATTQLTTATPNAADDEDDLAWRAAFVAGRHRSAQDTSASSFAAGNANLRKPGLRRLEQRMELLSQALLLAPPSHLPEVLAAWRRCEEGMGVLLAQEADEEEGMEEKLLPGGFGPSVSPVQTRREVGRGAVEEAPIGLFDVARGAAAAFSRSAFPLRGTAEQTRSQSQLARAAPAQSKGHERTFSALSGFSGAGSEAGNDEFGSDRVRKRDMVANAASGALASGLGWVLGLS